MKTTKNKIVYEENINSIKGKALAIVFPENMQEIKSLIKLSENDIIPRGSGSSFTGAVIPKDSVIIDFSKMNKIIEINPSRKTVTVESGVLFAELNAELEQYGLEFPIEPMFAGVETIGGMIAKNASGNREIRYNRMINWIDSLEVIDGKGEHIRVSKSDLSDFVGMEGITGIIILATLRLTNKKTRSLTILKASSLAGIFSANKELRFDPEISSIDLLSKELAVLLGLENKYHVFVEFEGEKGSLRGEEYQKYIKMKKKAYKKAATEGYYYMSNVKFLIESLQDFLIYLEQKQIPYIAHLASGVVYPIFRPSDIEKIQETLQLARRLRGRIAYNFGAGLTKKDALEIGEQDIVKRVKKRQDPQLKLNRDKLIDINLLEASNKVQNPEQVKSEIKEEQKNEAKTEEKTAEKEERLQEKTENKSEDVSRVNPETTTLKKPERELSQEEREKIKKIAAGFFAGGAKE